MYNKIFLRTEFVNVKDEWHESEILTHQKPINTTTCDKRPTILNHHHKTAPTVSQLASITGKPALIDRLRFMF